MKTIRVILWTIAGLLLAVTILAWMEPRWESGRFKFPVLIFIGDVPLDPTQVTECRYYVSGGKGDRALTIPEDISWLVPAARPARLEGNRLEVSARWWIRHRPLRQSVPGQDRSVFLDISLTNGTRLRQVCPIPDSSDPRPIFIQIETQGMQNQEIHGTQ